MAQRVARGALLLLSAAHVLGDLTSTCSDAAPSEPTSCLLQQAAVAEVDIQKLHRPSPQRLQMLETYEDEVMDSAEEQEQMQPPVGPPQGGTGAGRRNKPKPKPKNKPAPAAASTVQPAQPTAAPATPDILADGPGLPNLPGQLPSTDQTMDVLPIAPFGKEDTARELQDLAARTQDTLVDAVENAEVAEIKRAVFRSLTRLRAAQIKEFDTIARLETQAIDEYNDNHHYRKENPLQYLHSDEPTINEDKYTSFHE